MNKVVFFIFALLIFWGCKNDEQLFENRDVSKTGIDFINTITESNELNILDYLYFYNGGGVSIGDINNDGLPDIFFTGNQVKNKLYLNRGNLEFEDISITAGIEGKSTWNTGVTMADVNGDGFLDIYVCAVVGINGFNGFNELYINNQDNTFTESAAKYGLDFDSYSSNAAFFDYDLDGDLDLYLLNHAIHTQNSYGHANLRNERSYETGDKLLRNDNNKFVDVSKEAGIFGGINAYGLGLSVSDFNLDGYPDLYIGNDFHEDDYYYLNNGDGTFSESLKQYFGHTSRFSMGNDVADINHDGRPDILSLDMLPEDEKILKESEGDENIQIQKLRIERFGYHYQFTRNMLYVNQSDGNYMETALLSGVAATDWSWSSLFGDYDQDGEQDIFITNGIVKRPNNLDYIKFVSNDQIKKKIENTKLVDQEALNLMPTGKVRNYIFKGNKDITFQDKSGVWMSKDNTVSGATAMGDLDGDGDLDLVINNINQPANLYINKTDDTANYIKLQLHFTAKNKFGLGSKIYSYTNGTLQYKELFPVHGFQASSEPMIHFGYGEIQTIDSLKIVWPDKTYQILKNVKVNQTFNIKPEKTKTFDYGQLNADTKPLFKKVSGNLGIDFVHKEDNYTDFLREKLIPYQVSDRGPAVTTGDINSDGQDDILFGGSKFIPSQIFFQSDSAYVKKRIQSIANDSIKEDISAAIADFNNDGKNDILIATGGGDFFGSANALTDGYYLNENNDFKKGELPMSYQNSSVIRPHDFDNDGDLDVFIGGHTITGLFGAIPESTLLVNNNGILETYGNFPASKIGMVTDAIWNDFDNDGSVDLIVVGEWMSPKFFQNLNGVFKETQNLELNGLWQTICPFDIDNDGDLDYLVGNWGLNTKFKASKKNPLKLFFYDFDKNGKTETITAIEKNGKYFPLEGLDELSSQMVSLRKKFSSYSSFAGKSIDKIFDQEILKNAEVLTVETLSSGYLKNTNGSFQFFPFESTLQIAPIMAFLVNDFNADGLSEVLIGGNYFGIKPYQGRFDSFPGALLKNKNEIILGSELGLDFTKKSIRHLSIITFNNKPYLLATFNNDKAQVYEFFSK
ncbi:VCBS repeat-containing protein [Croceitalea rosinachiae]|uniref:VCBS repeat-containing protein n=1 Tax=Croceitalea rosinachiae TaxID=3075596 RepID=A0ABU3A9P7_9FLAO|nr:VCBS repeat-containing protein [Croceitalea sp. F388]MDT0606689.1 VCBS repeat-containing protein [Croceitalea sp. F388]